MKNQNAQQTALDRTKAKAEFRVHLINYLVINTILAVINLIFTPEYLWFKWPLLGWGIGLVFHVIRVAYSGNSSMKERMIERELERSSVK
jgi:hypothetical protein